MTTEAVPTEAPMSAPADLDHSRVWLLAAAPLLIFAIDAAFLYTGHSDSSTVSIGAAVAVTVALAAWDSRYLRSQGVPVPGSSAAWFVPGYLYQRSRLLRRAQGPLVVWIAVVVASVAAGLALDAHFVTLDMGSMQTQLEQWTNQQTGGTGAAVLCPSKATYAVGSTFVCSVSDATGSAHLIVKVESGDGSVTWQLVG